MLMVETEPPTRHDDDFEHAQRRYTPRYVEHRLRLLACPPPTPRLPEDDQVALPAIYARRSRREGEEGVYVSHGKPHDNPLEDRMGEVGLLLRLLDQLGEFPRQVIEVCIIGDMPYREFAEIHHVSIGHISNTKTRAIQEMAWRLGWRRGDAGLAL